MNWQPSKLKDGRLVEIFLIEWEPDDVATLDPGTIRCRAHFVIDEMLDSRVVTLTADLLEEIDPC